LSLYGQLVGGTNAENGKGFSPALSLMKNDSRTRHPRPLQRLAFHQEFLANNDPMIGAARFMEDH
jgi:hypothetical protein